MSRAASVFAAVIGVVVIVAGALSLMRAEVPPGQPIAATAAPTGSATAGGSATAAASRAVGEVSVRMGKVTAASEFRYVVSGGADTFRVILLDLGAGAATEVATVSVGAGGNPADGPYLFTSASGDGRAVLLTVNVPGARSTVLLLRPEAGDARELYRGSPFDRAVISPDGTRYALSRAADDPAVNGVWVGTLGAGAPRRLVADDPSASGAPPVPVAFAPDGQTLAVLRRTSSRSLRRRAGSPGISIPSGSSAVTRWPSAERTSTSAMAARSWSGPDRTRSAGPTSCRCSTARLAAAPSCTGRRARRPRRPRSRSPTPRGIRGATAS
ncbi:MAG: hypothetical protein AUI58_03640 [Chloroflexi bacterium 13_1_40CM_2_70_6]|nr:MAG: hypothetical protein AUI58_03640 [Chloroflexi bacterium 13_1_40CM_2_70_6]